MDEPMRMSLYNQAKADRKQKRERLRLLVEKRRAAAEGSVG